MNEKQMAKTRTTSHSETPQAHRAHVRYTLRKHAGAPSAHPDTNVAEKNKHKHAVSQCVCAYVYVSVCVCVCACVCVCVI